MKPFTLLVIPVVMVLSSCNNDTADKEKAADKGDTAKPSPTTIAAPVKDTSLHVSAKFVSFSQGDASHFIFKDEAGKEWNFAENADTTYKFSVELPKNKSNERNQGWESNKALQGKWFDITYTTKTQPQYPDGPMAKVPVIVSVKMKE